MPIYEYKCKTCGEKFELYQAIADDNTEVKCPRCGKKDVEKVPSSFFDSVRRSCSTIFPT